MAITVAMRTEISQLYVALFGRAPDADGLGFWVGLRDAGQSLTQIANTMYATAPARAYYPLFLTTGEIVASFYVNVLGRTADAEGLAYWTAKLNAPGATPGSVITEMVNVVAHYTGTDPAGLTSQALFNNKVEVAQYYGENGGDIAGATAILEEVTADHATVVAAIASLNETPPTEFFMVTGVETINAGAAPNSVVHGIGDAAGTYNTGDVIVGSTSTTLDLTLNGAAGIVEVQQVGNVEVNLLASTTLNTALYTGVGTVNVTGGLTGTTLTITNGDIATNYGLSATGKQTNLVVGFQNTTGAADTAKLILVGTGTSATVASAIDVSSTNTVEGVAIATSGTNFATLDSGTGAKSITITGDGANTLTFGTTATTLSVDASAATAAQKLTFASGSISSVDTIKGGTAADTVTANASSSFATMTGVETFVTTVNGGVALYDGSKVTGLTTMTINQGSAAGAEFFSNMKAEFATLNINGPTLTQDVNYVTDANATLTVNYGPGTSAFDATFDGLNVDEVGSLTVNLNVGGIAGVAMGSGTIALDKADTTSLTVIQAGSDDTVFITVDDADALDNLVVRATGDNSSIGMSVSFNSDQDVQGLQSLEITASGISSTAYVNSWENITWSTDGSGATYSVTTTTNAQSFGSVAITASGNSASAYMNTYIVNVGDVTTFDITASGNSSSAYMNYSWINLGNVGTINVVASGNSAQAYFTSYVSVLDGDVGTINVTASGDDSTASFDSSLYVYRGDIGTINIEASGNNASASMYYIYQYDGDIGDINITASGNSAWAYIYDLSLYTGDVGDVTILASGADASAVMSYMYVYSGDVNSISLTASGDSASAYGYEVSIYGNLGSWTLLASGDSASAYQELSYVSGDVGSMTITASGDGASAYLYTTLSVSGDVGSVTVTASGQDSDASFDSYFAYVAGNVGPVTVTASGQDSWASANFYVSGSAQSVVLTASGDGSSGSVEVYDNDGDMNLLALAVNATGADTWAGAYVDTGSGILGNVTIQASKANSSASLFFDGNTFGTIAATTGAPSSDIVLDLDNTTTAGGVITSSGSGTLTVTIQEKSISSLTASGQTNKVTVVVTDVTKATTGMTITTGSFADSVMGGKGVDTFNLGAGADTLIFSNVDAAATVSAVTDIIAGGFTSGSDKLDYTTAPASAAEYAESLTAAADFNAFLTAADTALTATVFYYFGVVGTDGYLAYDADGTGISTIVKITGVVDMAFGDII